MVLVLAYFQAYLMSGPEPIPRFQYVVPTTQIKTSDRVGDWEDAEAYQEYPGFIIAIVLVKL